MPLLGTRDLALAPEAAGAPEMASLDTEALVLEGVDVLQVMFETASAPMLDLLPPALHPTIPPTVTFVAWHAEDGPLGAFTLVQVRVGCRAGVRPRGYLLASVVDSEEAAAALSSRWGFRCIAGDTRFRRFHDRIEAHASIDGQPVLSTALVDPEAIAGGDVQYVASMHLARTPKGVRLVQVDPDYAFHKAERGASEVTVFDAAAFGDERLATVYPIAASCTVADLTLPKLRYICDPAVPAMQGTERA